MNLQYTIEIMHSDGAVESLVAILNAVEGIQAKVERAPVMKRTLHIEIADIDPSNGEAITNNDVLSLGSLIGTHLTALS